MKSIQNLDIFVAGLKIPVQVFPLSKSSRPAFEMVDSRDMAKIKCPRINSLTCEEVPHSMICKSYSSDGKRLKLPDDLLAMLSVKNDTIINLESFFSSADFSYMYLDSCFNLAPQKGWEDNYMMLFHALDDNSVCAFTHANFLNAYAPLVILADNNSLFLCKLKYIPKFSDPPVFNRPQISLDSAPYKALVDYISPRVTFFYQSECFDPFLPHFDTWLASQGLSPFEERQQAEGNREQ